jgi:hypothetical protein
MQLVAVAFLLNGKILSSWYANWMTAVKPTWQELDKKIKANGMLMFTRYNSDSGSSNFKYFYCTMIIKIQDDIITTSTY